MPKLDKATKARRDKGAIAGIRKHLRSGQTVTMGDVDYTPEELAQRFEEHLAALARVRQLTIEQRNAVAEERALEKKIVKLHGELKLHAVGRFGRHSARLLDFGIPPEKKPKMSAATKKRANEKRQQTRKERGVMGKKQLREWKKKRREGGG